MAAISQFPELKSLCLNDVLLRDEDARELRRLSALSSLTLTNCSYWGKPSAIPGVWNSLHTLTIQRSPLTPLRISQMVSLSNLPQLTVLNLSNYDLSDEDVREIQCLPSLRSLTLTNCTYSGHYSVISGELLSLHDLDLERSLLTPQTIEQLVKLRKLRNLRIRSTSSGEGQKVEEETMQRLHLALRECTIQVHDEQNRQLQHRHSFTQEAQWGEPERPNSSVNSF